MSPKLTGVVSTSLMLLLSNGCLWVIGPSRAHYRDWNLWSDCMSFLSNPIFALRCHLRRRFLWWWRARPWFWLRLRTSVVAVHCWDRYVWCFRETKVREWSRQLWRFHLFEPSIVWLRCVRFSELHFLFRSKIRGVLRAKHLNARIDIGRFHQISLPKLSMVFVALGFLQTRGIRLCLWVILSHLGALMDLIWAVKQVAPNDLRFIV